MRNNYLETGMCGKWAEWTDIQISTEFEIVKMFLDEYFKLFGSVLQASKSESIPYTYIVDDTMKLINKLYSHYAYAAH